jgi:pimeloyl-ACP methyl ester carboxylesterase
MPVLDRPGTFISYHAAGRGPALLLSHGFAATSAMFDANLPALTAGNLVATWDIRGHGDSGDPADQACYTARASVGDMLAILDHLGIGRAVIGGHSLGGYLSLRFALAHPERVSALLLIGTGPGFRSEASRAEWNRAAERQAASLAERGPDGSGAGPGPGPGRHRSAAGLARAARGILTQHDSAVIDGLGSIGVPALIVVGAQDIPFLGAADYLAGKLRDARLVVIQDAGHAPNVDQPERFGPHARQFLDEVAGPVESPRG